MLVAIPLFLLPLNVLIAYMAATSNKKKGSSKKTAASKGLICFSFKKSPKRKSFTQIKVSSSKQLFKPRYIFYILDLQGFVRIIWIEREGKPGTDAFGNPIHNAIGQDTNPFRHLGIMMVSYRRVSQENNMAKTNLSNDYPRKLIVGTYEEQENEAAAKQNRLAVLHALKDFMMRSENNKYGHEYFVDEIASDLTPANGNLEVVDNYLLDNAIVHFINAVYEGVSPSWYSEDEELALEYFTPPNFPTVAVTALGYPAPGTFDGEGAEAEADEQNEDTTGDN